MKSLGEIRSQITEGHFEFTQHALRRVVERNISDVDIQEAGSNVVIIEDYPTDKYSPSCLLLGYTTRKRPLHIQVSRLAERPLVKIITIYEPDPAEWVNFIRRRT